MLAPVRTVAPAATPVSVAEAKTHCDISYSDDDTMLGILVAAATERFDGWAGILGRCLVTQTWRVDCADWPATAILRLPFPDIQSIASVKYSDTDNQEQTVSSSLYALYHDQKGGLVRFSDSFTSPGVYDDRLDAVRVTFVAGYGDASDVPAPIRAAVLMMTAHLYENREAVSDMNAVEVPYGVKALTDPYRWRIG